MQKPIGEVTTRTILELALESHTDPRSVKRELAALKGEGRAVRGSAGERIRAALAAKGFLQPSSAA